ncbi:inorganic phosphate transporter [Microvirga tunisiensis]|uniref:Phosphate transporter n=1 Tax=Pannonibacter tanglangensis TaxID=2750084 RepID=A0A7X5J8R0_9HYPH|nr:inorganic phosphate transporter [Pannonibacter sp. XCT-53]
MAKTDQKSILDKDLDKIAYIEEATESTSRRLVAPGLAFLFLVLTVLLAASMVIDLPGGVLVIVAAALGAYMALTIGANDVANNVGPAVGARAISLPVALAMAAVCESAGALIAGGDVIETISGGIITPLDAESPHDFALVMLSALLAAGIWIHFANWVRAPVSTTHSIVGAVLGAAIGGIGIAPVNWSMVGSIMGGWLVSPVLSACLAAALLAFIRSRVVYQFDKIDAARRWVPRLIGVMAGAFATYLTFKGLSRVVNLDLGHALFVGLVVGVLTHALVRPIIHRQSIGLENRNQSVRQLFGWPLVGAAGLLSFAHGANDVANAVGPVAAIAHAMSAGAVSDTVRIPFWVMLIGAFGISLGLSLFGPRLIRLVGQQITKLNPMRAFCIALATALTVILASALGLPVSTTHVTVGAVFGVGFFREWETQRLGYRADTPSGRAGLRLRPIRNREEQKRRLLVRRSHVMTILVAWMVTVPSAALLAGVIRWLLSGVL